MSKTKLIGVLAVVTAAALVPLYGDPRNAPTEGVHGYLGLQDVPPMELRRIGRKQARDAGAEVDEGAVVESVEGEIDGFVIRLADGVMVS